MNARNAACLLLCAALLPACAETRPPLADTWGLSVRMAVENQKLDPTPAGVRPVAGLDGVFAKNAMDAYRKSAEPDPAADKAREKPLDAILLMKGGK